MKAWQIARRLLRQNRWLFVLLILWPFAMAAILLRPGGMPHAGDVLFLLREECIYGLALVAFIGSVQLGSEQRSRRAAAVLSRAVSRGEYLLALLLSAWIPLALYAISFLLSGLLLLHSEMFAVLLGMASSLLLLGLWSAAVSLFFAAWLPSWLASTATLATIFTGFLWGHAEGRFLRHLWSGMLGEDLPRRLGRRWSMEALILVALAAVFFWAATAIFERRDLDLKDG